MFHLLVLVICTNYLTISEAFEFLSKNEEYCNSEIFSPRCERNQILIIESAIYGRKKFGRCLMNEEDPSETNLDDPKLIGCYSDVKHVIMPKCFGKQECDLRISGIKASTSCYKYLKLYLEVSYSCVAVVQPTNHCTIIITQEKQFIFGPHKLSCGSQNRPWIIETAAGQKLILNGILFKNNSSSKLESTSLCRTIGYVTEKSFENNNNNNPICLPASQHEMEIYKTKSNQMEIYIDDNLMNEDIGNYLMSVEATGCSDLIPPADAWLKRTENEATIGCYSTRLRWQLKCVGQRWIGVIGNCSYAHPYQSQVQNSPSPVIKNHNQNIIIFAIVMIGAVFCLFIACIGIVCLKRHYVLSKSNTMKQFTLGSRVCADMNLLTTDNNFMPNGKSEICNGGPYVANGLMESQDTAPYFELDQSLMKKEPPLFTDD